MKINFSFIQNIFILLIFTRSFKKNSTLGFYAIIDPRSCFAKDELRLKSKLYLFGLAAVINLQVFLEIAYPMTDILCSSTSVFKHNDALLGSLTAKV